MINFFAPFGNSKPSKPKSSFSLLRPLAKNSLAMIKRVGDSGSPCFTPLDDSKKPTDYPLTSIEYQLLEISLHAISMILSSKPKLLITLVKKIHETLS